MATSKTKCYACEETEQEDTQHDAAYRIYKLLYYQMIFLGAVLFLVFVDVSVFKDYSLRQTMLYVALAGTVLITAERTLDYKLKKWGVIS